ncbi:MAG: glycosyltransferase family 39 protein [Pseudomonadota bacterium]|nr:glycosyltransferase family 39 protein [Pseudomonadota bacterium]
MYKFFVIKNYLKKYSEYIIFTLILILASMSRLVFLDSLPAGLNQDEAFAAYESYSLFTTGRDTAGNIFSVYFPTWGPGMSVLYGYLTVPFFALFGVSTLTARLPQALFGILSCYVFFRLAELMYNKRVAYIAFFLSAIMPWHIMMSRWGIEVNYAPFCILTGFYFFVKSFQSISYLVLSSLFYGLGIYAYDCCAIYIVCSFLFQLFCRLFCDFNKKTFCYILLSGLLFSLIIFPFLLLIAVNNDIIPEIKSFITIPKIHAWRQGNLSFSGFITKLGILWRIFYTGSDGAIYNSINEFGILYHISLPFIFVGIYAIIRDLFILPKSRKYNIVVLGTLIIGILYSGLIYANVNRLNYLWFNIILLLSVGINYLFSKKRDLLLIVGIYTVFYISFFWFYLTQYNILSKNHFHPDLEKSLQLALNEHNKSGYPIYVISPTEVYPKILFWNKIPVQDYRQTVKWYNENATFKQAKSFSFYHILPNLDVRNIIHDAIYIIPNDKKKYFSDTEITSVGEYAVAISKTRIKARHPVWEEDLVLLSDKQLIRPSVSGVADILRFSDTELWVKWDGNNEEHFVKDAKEEVYCFQQK